MRKMTRWMLAAILTFCGAMMMLTACTDAIGTVDNPVIPDPPYDPAGELANETFLHEDWMDRTVRPGDSFWDFANGSWQKNHDDLDMGTWVMSIQVSMDYCIQVYLKVPPTIIHFSWLWVPSLQRRKKKPLWLVYMHN